MSEDDAAPRSLREEHVARFIRGRGISDKRVLKAMESVPRECFIPDVSLAMAYGDHPVPIACNQTISQPFMVAWMTEILNLEPDDRVLEIGTGCGYQTAVIAELVSEVYTIEWYAPLLEDARKTLGALGYANVHFKTGDGSLGWREHAPFNAIIVTAGAPAVPESLRMQLGDGGRLVIPVGDRMIQELVRVERKGDEFMNEALGGCRFVPLVGEEGWKGGEG